jgi:hypothetical protein
MATADRRPIPLEVVGQMMVEMGGGSTRIEALGDRIVVELSSLGAGIGSFRGVLAGNDRAEAIRRIDQALRGAGLSLEVVVGGRVVGRLGEGARAGLASKLLGLGPLELVLGGVLGSLGVRERPPG